MSPQWQQQRERSTPFALKLIRWIALHLGRGIARLLLYPIVGYFLLTSREASRASREFLSRALGRQATVSDTARHLHCFASTILDRIFLLTDRFDEFDIRIHGEQVAREYGRKESGCLLIGSHLGSFEVLRALGIEKEDEGIRVKMLMNRGQNEMITRILEALNPDIGEMMIDTGGGDADTAIRIKQALDEGCVVSMLGDRVNSMREKYAMCDFLGDRAMMPLGWLMLASVLRVPVMICFGLYRGGNRYDIHFELLSEGIHLDRRQREAQASDWAQCYAQRLEHYARLAPYNWFNFYDFWDDSHGQTNG